MSHKQPYIYTLPEQFLDDPTVPMHWKLYTIINGFWISGKPVFASNSFFAQKLKCSDRYVRECLEKLENMGLLLREGMSQNRRIVPAARAEQGGTSSSGGEEPAVPVREEPAVPHISDSNSDNIKRAEKLRVVSEEEDKPKRAVTRSKERQEVFKLFSSKPQPWWHHPPQRDAALRLFDSKGLKQIRIALDFYNEHKDEKYCPQIFTPYDLEAKWSKLHSYGKKL